MSITTFETLPDEILMIIIRYSGEISVIFRTFSGLNQRMSSILIDKRMHLLTDFLFMDGTDVNIDHYYKSDEFHDISRQLYSLKGTENDQQFRQCLQALVTFHIRYKYKQSGAQLDSCLEQFRLIRSGLSVEETSCRDLELKNSFKSLKTSMKNIKLIEPLVFIKGARLECPDSEYIYDFNFTEAVNYLLVTNSKISQRSIHILLRMFKSVLISNLDLLFNRAYVVHGGCVVCFFLFYAIYRCEPWNHQESFSSFNMHYYEALIDLLLFALQCLKYKHVNDYWWIETLSDVLLQIRPIQLKTVEEILIYTSQIEILRILLDEKIFELDNYALNEYPKAFGNLIKCLRLDIVLFMLHYHEPLRDATRLYWNQRKCVNMVTSSPMTRRLFLNLLDDETIGIWLSTNEDLLFILLQKKECQLVKRLISVVPLLANRLDRNGNNPLLYVTLNVRGCRHRLVEYLIRIGCDLKKKNSRNENFIDALRLRRNEKLLKKLIKHEIISIDRDTEEIEMHLI